MKLKSAIFSDNLCFNRFSERLTNFKIDSIKWNGMGKLALHHFYPNDITFQISYKMWKRQLELFCITYIILECGFYNFTIN